jgi:RND family efflux transporter MFP subunit
MKNIFNLTFVAILVVGFIIGSYLYKDLSQRPTAQLQKENVAKIINLNGKVKSENESDLGFEIGGRVIALNYKVGDRVSRGAVLAKVDSSDLNAQYQSALNEVESAKAVLEKNEKLVKVDEYKLKSLKHSGADSNTKKAQEAQISADKATVESQEATVRALINSAQVIKDDTGKTVILAPFNGLITKQDVKVGEIAVSNTVNPLPILTLVDENNLQIEAYASQLDVKNIFVGQVAKVTLDNDEGKILEAKVISVDPAATIVNNISTYKVVLNFSDKSLRPTLGTDANIEINLGN